MKTVRLRSLQAKLALRLAALYVAATAIAVAVLIYQTYETADTLNDRELSLRAADLARHVTVDSTGAARLELPTELAARYQAAGNSDIFAVRRSSNAVIAASPPTFGEVAAKWPAGTDEPSYFHLKDFGGEGSEYYGLTVVQSSAAGPLSVSVARAADADILLPVARICTGLGVDDSIAGHRDSYGWRGGNTKRLQACRRSIANGCGDWSRRDLDSLAGNKSTK